MRGFQGYAALIGFVVMVAAIDNFTMSVSPPPVPGQHFQITWNPDSNGQIEVLLNNFGPDNPALDIITFSDILATVYNTGRFVWDVPSNLSCGRYSFSIAADYEIRLNYGEIWAIPCPSTSATVLQTTACVTSAPAATGANPFTFPSTDDAAVRVGKPITILWNPTTSGSISIAVFEGSSNTTTTIADKIPNSGSFSWTPSSNFATSSTDPSNYVVQIIDDGTQKITSTSASISVLTSSYQTVFININSWMYPVTGKPVTIQWSPSNASVISLEVTFGMIPHSADTVSIADKVSNNGSFTWDVPPDLKIGRYTVIAFTPGHLFDDVQAIVIGNIAPTACQSSSLSVAPPTAASSMPTSSLSSGPDSATSSSIPLSQHTVNYEQILQTSCAALITPSYTSIVSSGTTTSFPTVGCPISATQATSTLGCHSGFANFSVAASTMVCCPNDWGTSSLDVIYCFTSVSPTLASVAGTAQSSASPTVVIISNEVFARAGSVISNGLTSHGIHSVIMALILLFTTLAVLL